MNVSFIRALIARAMVEQAIDAKRVYAFGYSNGGHMTFRLAIEAPDEIAAVAAVAAILPTPDNSSCPQQGRTSRFMLVNGRGSVMSSLASAQTFAEQSASSGPATEGLFRRPYLSRNSDLACKWRTRFLPLHRGTWRSLSRLIVSQGSWVRPQAC
jgi:poly(3-hydroxybutyrate) depolymerase